MKTSTRSGSAAIVTMVLSVLSLLLIATVIAAVRGDNITHSSFSDINGKCAGPDLVIASVVPYTFGKGNDREYTVYITNIGNATAILDYPQIAGWEAYLSKDGISQDVHVQGKNFSGTLVPGQTTAASASFSADPDSYPYIIVQLYVLSNVGECNSSNNTVVLSSIFSPILYQSKAPRHFVPTI